MGERSEAQKTRVAVVFGGRGAGHAISCVSASSVLAALDADEFEAVPVGVTREGTWVLAAGPDGGLAIDGGRPEVVDVVAAPDGSPTGRELARHDGPRTLSEVDIVFPVLHPPLGADTTIQGLLEMAGVPYVGASVFASAAAADAEFTRKLVGAEGVPVAPYAVVRPGGSLPASEQARLGLPVQVRPARSGSPYGVSRVTDWDQLDAAVEAARRIGPKVLVETAVIGREVQCGLLDGVGRGPDVSALAEARLTAESELHDAETEHEYDIPAPLPERVTKQIQEYAGQAFTALDCSGLAQVRFVVTPELDIYLGDVVTMPGLTPASLFPMMWAASGVGYPALVARLIRSALQRGAGLS